MLLLAIKTRQKQNQIIFKLEFQPNHAEDGHFLSIAFSIAPGLFD